MATFRSWLWRIFLVGLWIVMYWVLPEPFDTYLALLTGLSVAIWLYNRLSGRFTLPPLKIKFERLEAVTPTHILLALILLVMLANHTELGHVRKTIVDVQDSVTDLQNAASDNTDAITSSLDDVKTAIEANQ